MILPIDDSTYKFTLNIMFNPPEQCSYTHLKTYLKYEYLKMGCTGNPILSAHNVIMTPLLDQEPRRSDVIIAFLLRYVHGGFRTQFDQLVNFGETSI